MASSTSVQSSSSTTTATQNFRMQQQQSQPQSQQQQPQQVYSSTRTFASSSTASTTTTTNNIPEELIYSYESGLDELIKQAKSWSKYMKELVQYIEKRCQIESDYNRQVLRNAQNLQQSIDNLKKDKAFLPFDNVYNQFCLNEIRNAKICGNNFDLLIKNILQPITEFQQEFDKKIKKIKEDWSKENKQLNEALNNMKKSREIFYSKINESKSKSHHDIHLEWNPEKWERDILTRNEEAHANVNRLTFLYDRQKKQFRSIKKGLIIRLQDLLIEIEMKIKEITSHYYETLRDSLIHSPEEITLAINDTNNYESGKSYRDFAESLPLANHYQQQQQPKTSTSSNHPNFHLNYENFENFDSSESDNNNSTFYIKQQSQQQQRKDRNILMNISSNKQQQYHHQQQQQQKQQVHENFVIKSAEKKYKSIHGYYSNNSNDSGLVDQSSGGKRKNFFGVALSNLSTKTVPDIIKQCIKQIESRGSRINGIYRVSAVKSQVDNLCSAYESNPNSIDLSRISPNVIANFLKQFFRMLPEPLLTFRLYPDLIEIATKYSKNHQIDEQEEEEIINSLKKIVKRLPEVHYNTLKYLMRHLKQISKDSDINQMNPSNLGIVFGPTLLKKGDDDNAAFLYDTNHQSRIVELLILYSDQIFDLKPQQQQQSQHTSQDSSTSDDNDSLDLTTTTNNNNKNETTTTINRHHLNVNVTTNGNSDTPKTNQQQQQRLTLAKSATCSSIRQQSDLVKHDMSQARLKFFASNNQPTSSTLFQHYSSSTGGSSGSYSSSLINNNNNNNNNETISSNKSVPSLMPSSSSNKLSFKNDLNQQQQQMIIMSPFSQITSASSSIGSTTTPGGSVGGYNLIKNQDGRLIRRITTTIGQQQPSSSASQHHLISSSSSSSSSKNDNNKIYQKHNELSKSSSDIYSYKNISNQISLMPNDDHV